MFNCILLLTLVTPICNLKYRTLCKKVLNSCKLRQLKETVLKGSLNMLRAGTRKAHLTEFAGKGGSMEQKTKVLPDHDHHP